MTRHLKKTPVVLSSQNYPSSTSGNIYYRFQFEEIDLNYDVQSTTSLVSPYTGYILLKVQVKSNTKSGDVKGYETIVGFADSVDAMQNNDFESCAESNYDMNQWCVGDIKINYAYQNDKWIFKNVEAETKNKIQYGTVRGDIERGAINNLFKN